MKGRIWLGLFCLLICFGFLLTACSPVPEDAAEASAPASDMGTALEACILPTPSTMSGESFVPAQTSSPDAVADDSSTAQPMHSGTEVQKAADASASPPPSAQTAEPALYEPDQSAQESAQTTESVPVVTLAIVCHTVLENYDKLDAALRDERFVPADGIILEKTEVPLQEGDSVYDILSRTCREKGILVESSYTPISGSAYVEGINNLYEFSCGSLSGWVFLVNGEVSGVGCSSYFPSAGDDILWSYTCDLGRDLQ